MSKHILVNGAARHIVGWKPDVPDHRDIMYPMSMKIGHMPAFKDLRTTGFLPRVEDQGDLGSCTMNSSTSGMEFLYRKAGIQQPEMSRLFGYYAERVKVRHEDPTNDSGAMIREAIQTLSAYGTCLETSWPYDTSKFAVEPPKEAWEEALKHRIIKYYRVTGIDGIKSCICDGFPIVIGFSVPQNMDSQEAAATGVLKYPELGEPIIGGHAVLVVGYNDTTKQICFQNSWSEAWGDKGFGYLPYTFFSNGLASDFWTIRTEDM